MILAPVKVKVVGMFLK